ncbi:hypothetical protein UFOVP244_43 [uncultured Caudovirales phage]|uniref:Uncharacterized protein n=1 Tax=uncultured Caudovirales phage TaxID=2100421 RepID=A0A6J7WXL1_9CAUD|nr:hypothetical protein UFOVP244_43 [uncultured Caudovirales phage]
MAIKFIKELSKNNPYDNAEVVFTVSNHLSVDDLIEEFRLFLLAISFSEETVAGGFIAAADRRPTIQERDAI